MPTVLDFHTHSYHSTDGGITPQDLVAGAKANNPAIAAMALSDHNTYSGCQDFLAACKAHGVEGFVSAEVSGAHPDRPDIEFHFLTMFGNAWTEDVSRRTAMFTPHFNALYKTDTENILLFLEAAGRLGHNIPLRSVVQKSVAFYHGLPDDRKNPAMIGPATFHRVREVLDDLKLIDHERRGGKSEFEKDVWRKAGVKPAPTPNITDAYPIYGQARPAVILAHPMHYGLSVEQLRPFIEEWIREIGLIGLEAHYAGVLHAQWKALADELGLLVSAGSDRHNGYIAGDPTAGVPVVEDGQADMNALLEALRRCAY